MSFSFQPQNSNSTSTFKNFKIKGESPFTGQKRGGHTNRFSGPKPTKTATGTHICPHLWDFNTINPVDNI